jgi:predicted NBD/HSP70 family sugar kinase
MYILADIGATKMRIAGSRDLSSFEDPVIFDTPWTYEEGLQHFVGIARSTAGNEKIQAVAIGVPAVLSHDKRSLRTLTNLPNWNNHDFAEDLEKALKSKVYLENDTALVGLGEATDGAGKGVGIMVYITVSTGVNGVRIVQDIIDPSAYGFEIGYQLLSVDEVPRRWGDLISGKALAERFGKHPRELGKDNPVWEELARTTALGVHNTMLHWSPDRVVLGGSMFNDIGISIESVKKHLAEIFKAFPEVPEVVHSALGDLGGLHGGMARLKQLI